MSRMKICGIHTRLQNIVNKSGGINYESRIVYLMNTYNLSYDTAQLLYNTDNEKRVINGEPLSVVLKDVYNKNRKSGQLLNSLFTIFQRQNEEIKLREECRK